MGARLVAIGAAATGGFRLNAGRTAIGSAPDNTCVIAHPTVSRRHATLEHRDGTWLLTDASSSNGTFVNGRRILATVPVHDGDQLRFGGAAYLLLTDPLVRSRWSSIGVAPMLLLAAFLVAGAFATTFYLIYLDRMETAGRDGVSAPGSAPGRVLSPPLLQVSGGATAVPTPARAPLPTSGATEQAAAEAWLYALNQYRSAIGAHAVTSNPHLSPGCELHSRYVVKNYGNLIASRTGIGAAIHSEDPTKPGFSQDGLVAAREGTVDEMFDPGGIAEPAWAIDDWIRAPFHRLSLLAPHLRSVGYGQYCEKSFCIATMNVLGDVDDSSSGVEVLAAPIAYPPYDGVIKQTAFNGEWPDPLTSCPGYASPAGFAITLELGSIAMPEVSRYSLEFSGRPADKVETCLITADNYNNPDANAQSVTRGILGHFGAIVLIPHSPLETGKYAVSITSGSHTYAWSFSVKP